MSHRAWFLCAMGLLAADLTLTTLATAGRGPKEWSPSIQPSQFTNVVTNPYFPLPSGRILRYEGQTKDGLETLEIQVGGTKTVMGVSTRVVTETHRLDGQVVEISENWFAQHQDGTVWYFGEFSQTFENGSPTGTSGSWEAGKSGALPGIIMEASPQPGDAYFQEYAPDVAQDQAQVLSTTRSETVRYGSFSNVLLTKEWTALESSSVEHKSYASGFGLILEEKGGERVELVSIQ